MTLAELARKLNGELHGEGSYLVDGMATLDHATAKKVSFLTKKRYIESAKNSKAGCIIAKSVIGLENKNIIISSDPHLAYVEAMYLFYPEEKPQYEISATSVIDNEADIADKVRIENGAVIEKGCKLQDGVVIGAGAILKKDCVIGENSIIHPGVIFYPRTQVGKRVVVHANAVVGSDGFGYYLGGKSPLKVPQVGQVVIGDDVEIGACACIERATLELTQIGNRVKIGEHVLIGHNVSIGDDVVIIGHSLISGSVKIGNSVRIWGRVGVRGHLVIGDGALVLANSFVMKSVPNGQIVGGAPALPHMQWKRIVAGLSRLPEILRELRIIKKQT